MSKTIVEYNREKCIGASSCVAVHPDRWSLDDEAKAVLKDATIDGDTHTLEIEDSELEQQKMAAESCPVRVILLKRDGKVFHPEDMVK
tara:strand:+ start:340 stop:603 length:264 start_codon:yes stop_codon:yes gene_type:complete